ncbi:hypothetical protein CERZMDRAFT_102206 [Cercospora zeae-maydis SCOH1-5]|uniref:Wax synthase domain-containing protein n=1 Tax=Cercospora zeae-maydis SCOH1-5 TaxID=717836 RepID=A0A6A6F5A2_9PEZI|nr:hypothetical protein CERZMDRAFT_102206 [Cercospora zeae-maydis SCOH1-5]
MREGMVTFQSVSVGRILGSIQGRPAMQRVGTTNPLKIQNGMPVLEVAMIFSTSMITLLLPGLFYFLAIRQPANTQRYVLGTLLLLSVAYLFWTMPGVLQVFPMTVPFITGLSIHSASIIFCRGHQVKIPSTGFAEQIKLAVKQLIDIRGTKHGPDAKQFPAGSKRRLHFALRISARMLLLWLLNQVVIHRLPRALLPEGMELDDLAPSKQTLLPQLSRHDLAVRALITINWIWGGYYGLGLPYDICSIICVSILGINESWQWPPLFGSILEATSLHRFWGTFWQKLHVRPFEAFTPRSLHRYKLIRALTVFLISAGCHVFCDIVVYGENTSVTHLRFFLLSFVVCSAEIAVLRLLDKMNGLSHYSWKWDILLRPLGYIWVFVFFLCVTPQWQYPLIVKTLQGMVDQA